MYRTLERTRPKKKDHNNIGSFSKRYFKILAKEKRLTKIPKKRDNKKFPFTFFQLWSFIKPGLKTKEVHATRWIVFNASLLFFLGVLFGYYLISPLCVQFFGGYKLTDEIQNNFTISSYMSMITTSTFLTGLFFELPVVMYLLAKIGVLSSAVLKKYRRHSIVVILILSAIITPPDVISQLLVTFPIYTLYEIGIVVVKRVEKRKET